MTIGDRDTLYLSCVIASEPRYRAIKVREFARLAARQGRFSRFNSTFLAEPVIRNQTTIGVVFLPAAAGEAHVRELRRE